MKRRSTGQQQAPVVDLDDREYFDHRNNSCPGCDRPTQFGEVCGACLEDASEAARWDEDADECPRLDEPWWRRP